MPLGGQNHVGYICDEPRKFGFTRDELEAAYGKYNEPLYSEGRAREELILDAIRRGFVRIRLVPNVCWKINVHEFDARTQAVLKVWAEGVRDYRFAGPYMSCEILETARGNILNSSIDALCESRQVSEKVPVFVAGIHDFEDLI